MALEACPKWTDEISPKLYVSLCMNQALASDPELVDLQGFMDDMEVKGKHMHKGNEKGFGSCSRLELFIQVSFFFFLFFSSNLSLSLWNIW